MIRRILILFSFMWLFMAITCDNEPYEGDLIEEIDLCGLAIQTTLEASDAFNTASDEDYNLLCQTYQDALQDQIEICGDPAGELQAIIETLGDCIPDGPSSCELAIIATELAFQEFSNTSNDDYQSTCESYKLALQDQIIVCGDDGTLQTLIEELGDCVVNDSEACDMAIEATAMALAEVEDAITVEYEAACVIYREALQNQINVCGDDGTLQDLINDLGNCEPEIFNLVGDWRLIVWQSDIPRDIDNDGVQTSDYLTEIDCFENETASFNDDGTGTLFYRESMVVEVSSPTNDPSDLEYTVECFEDIRNFDFTWTQEGDSITVTLDSDGTVLDFFRNGDVIFIAMRDFFVATSTSSNVEDIVQDIIWAYVQF
ncbi:hypothetical protein [Winogradskyella sp. A2]|uniref:hypothetical protein n=1 Tax=Winogradskyella sp. A2 TaxID=3366944 RepID=UPI00398C3261